MKRFIFLTLLALILLPGGWLVLTATAATETPEYTVESEDGDFEIRVYPDLKLVTTTSKDREMNGSFMKLFRYIDGGNAAEEKISMTSPVLMTKSDETSTMSFIVPKDVAEKGAPDPSSEQLALKELPAMRVAAYRYSGHSDDKKEQDAFKKLQAWMTQQNLQAAGEPLYAGYNPPWTPGFMRRNEVMVPLPPAK